MEVKRISDHKSYQITDQEAIERILNGEKELFEILLRRYNQTLYRVIRSYLKSDPDVEDIMQVTYIKAWERLNQFKGDSAFSTWLIRIGINETLMYLRRQKNNNVLPFDNSASRLDNMDKNRRTMTPENKIIQTETKNLLEKAVDQLPEKYRTVYMLREIEGLNNRDTSESLQISESNVKIRLHRARLLLKDTLFELADRTDAFEFGYNRCDHIVDQVMERII